MSCGVAIQAFILDRLPIALEAMIAGGWIIDSLDPSQPVAPANQFVPMRWHEETNEGLKTR